MSYGEIGPWSEIKLDIIREYASAYSRILNAQGRFEHLYIDAFAGSGVHVSRMTGNFVPGSPLNALLVLQRHFRICVRFRQYERGRMTAFHDRQGSTNDEVSL